MITLALADDHTLFRKSMTALLELVGDFQVVFQAANGKELITYLEQSAGFLIVATGYTNGTIYTDGTNSVGYCNLIIIQAPYVDPTTGSVLVSPFGGTATTNQNLATAITNVAFTGARLINLSKQTQLTFRVITRDMDSATRIRSNNA
jgi:DNA-binding NarL/FixJ family response regulator